jgi:hypothetical protein
MKERDYKVQGRGTAPLPVESSLTLSTFVHARNNRVTAPEALYVCRAGELAVATRRQSFPDRFW